MSSSFNEDKSVHADVICSSLPQNLLATNNRDQFTELLNPIFFISRLNNGMHNSVTSEASDHHSVAHGLKKANLFILDPFAVHKYVLCDGKDEGANLITERASHKAAGQDGKEGGAQAPISVLQMSADLVMHKKEAESEQKFKLNSTFFYSILFELFPMWISMVLCWLLEGAIAVRSRKLHIASAFFIIDFFVWCPIFSFLIFPPYKDEDYDSQYAVYSFAPILTWIVYILIRGLIISVKYAFYGNQDIEGPLSYKTNKNFSTSMNLMAVTLSSSSKGQVALVAGLYTTCLRNDVDLNLGFFQIDDKYLCRAIWDTVKDVREVVLEYGVKRENKFETKQGGDSQKESKISNEFSGDSDDEPVQLDDLDKKLDIGDSSEIPSKDRAGGKILLPGFTSTKYAKCAFTGDAVDLFYRTFRVLDNTSVDSVIDNGIVPASFVALCMVLRAQESIKFYKHTELVSFIINLGCSAIRPIFQYLERGYAFGSCWQSSFREVCLMISIFFLFRSVIFYSMLPCCEFYRRWQISNCLVSVLNDTDDPWFPKFTKNAYQKHQQEALNARPDGESSVSERDRSGSVYTRSLFTHVVDEHPLCERSRLDMSIPENVKAWALIAQVLQGPSFLTSILMRMSVFTGVILSGVVLSSVLPVILNNSLSENVPLFLIAPDLCRTAFITLFVFLQILIAYLINLNPRYLRYELTRAQMCVQSELPCWKGGSARAVELSRAAELLRTASTSTKRSNEAYPMRILGFRAEPAIVTVLGTALVACLSVNIFAFLKEVNINMDMVTMKG